MARKARIETPATLSEFVREVAKEDRAAALTFFLLDTVGSIWGTWSGRMTADDQRALFGRYLGKGKLYIDGTRETVEMWVKVCFGTDGACEFRQPWSAVAAGQLSSALFDLGHIAQARYRPRAA